MPRSAERRTSRPPISNGVAAPDISKIEIDDGKPVDSIYSERQMRLLVDSLYASWPGPGKGRPFVALANVGIFMTPKDKPIVPDVLLSLDVVPGNPRKKENLTYFVWVIGKLPEVVIEIVSNRRGQERTRKKEKYARMGIPYYVVWDLKKLLEDKQLHCFVLSGGSYEESDTWFPQVNVGVDVWTGKYQGMNGPWLRWKNQDGEILLTGSEQAVKEREKTTRALRRADREKQRADTLAAKLRALGVDPDAD